MKYNFRKEIELNDKNYSSINPINKNNVKRKKINGKYVYERFYLIDFLNIKENSYVISSFGRIFSLITNKELIPTTEPKKNNYKTIILVCNDGKQTKFPLHRLVARAFIEKTASDKKMKRVYVHHKNWDNEYNYFWNLEWRSSMEIKMLEKIQSKKEISEEDIAKVVCKLLERKETIVDIFEIINGKMSKDKISKIKNGLIYKDISCKYNI